MKNTVDSYLCSLSRASSPICDPVIKIGGSPVFLAAADWPQCSHCGARMEFIAQLPLRDPLPLSTSWDMAYVFMCPGRFDDRGWLECQTWAPNSGANAVLLQRGSDPQMSLARPPAYPEYAVSLRHCLEPDVDTANYDQYDECYEDVSSSTKLGGVAVWLQTNETPPCPACGGDMRLIAQIDAELEGALPADPREWSDMKKSFLQFGDGGVGYVFLCKNECGPNGAAFLWQTL
jgi:hypothetical protein